MSFPRTWRCWLEAGFGGGADPTILTPMAVFRMEPWAGKSPEEQAAAADAFWDGLKLPDELCGLHITTMVDQFVDPNRPDQWTVTPQTILEHFRANAVDPREQLDKLRRFVRALRRRPVFIYHDGEAVLDRFGLPSVDFLTPAFNDALARRWMPAGLDGVTADQVFDFWSPGHTHRPLELYNGHAADLVRRSLDLWVRCSGLLDGGARFVQAQAVCPRRPVYDFNGWEQTGRVVSSGTSNWFCYGGAGQRHQNLTVPAGWAAMADEIEVVRACTDGVRQLSICPHLATNADPTAEARRSGTPGAPACWCHPFTFRNLMGHIARTPQPGWPMRDLLLFNEYADPKREAEVQAMAVKHFSDRLAAVLQPVSLTQPTITTGNFTSQLADYQLHVK